MNTRRIRSTLWLGACLAIGACNTDVGSPREPGEPASTNRAEPRPPEPRRSMPMVHHEPRPPGFDYAKLTPPGGHTPTPPKMPTSNDEAGFNDPAKEPQRLESTAAPARRADPRILARQKAYFDEIAQTRAALDRLSPEERELAQAKIKMRHMGDRVQGSL